MGMGAQVTILDINHDRLTYLDDIFQGHIQTRASNGLNIEQAVFNADLVIGTVLIQGAAPGSSRARCCPVCAKAR